MGSRQDSFFERESVLGSFVIVVSEAVIELNDPDGHKPDHPPEMTVAALGNPAASIMLAGLVYGRVNPRHGNQFSMIFEIPDITSRLDEKVCCRIFTNPPKRSHDINAITHITAA